MPAFLTVLPSLKNGLVLLFAIVVDVVAGLLSFQYSSVLFVFSLTVITRRRAAVIKISVAVPSNITRITNACVIVDAINAATFKK